MMKYFTNCQTAEEAIAICEADPDGNTGFLKIRLNKKVSDLYVKKIALAEIW